MKRRYWAAGLLLLSLGAAGAIAARTRAPPSRIDPASLVTVQRGPLTVDILETGRVEPFERIELKSKVAGQVIAVNADEGQAVTKGQVLISLDPNDYQREVARAEADLASASAAIDYSRLRAERLRLAVAARVVPQSELDEAAYQVQSALARLAGARVALSVAQDRVRYATIVAPIDGTVIQRNIEVGEVVVPGVQATFEGRPLLTVANLSALLVKVELNQIDVAKVAVGARVSVQVDALPGRTFEATVTRIAAASVKPLSGTVEVFPVEATLSPADSAIKPGMTADVRIAVESRADVLLLPIEAINREHGKAIVSRVHAEGTPEQTQETVDVVLGVANDREQEVVSGVAAGDRILVNPPSTEGSELKPQ